MNVDCPELFSIIFGWNSFNNNNSAEKIVSLHSKSNKRIVLPSDLPSLQEVGLFGFSVLDGFTFKQSGTTPAITPKQITSQSSED